MTKDPWEPPLAGTEVEQLTGALDRLRTTFRWKAWMPRSCTYNDMNAASTSYEAGMGGARVSEAPALRRLP
jgi:hypothetical protein